MSVFLSLSRSSGFQDRQIRNLFSRHYKHRSYFKEAMMRFEVERKQTLRRKRQLQGKLDELRRRKAFLRGRRDQLLKQINEREGRRRRRLEEAEMRNYSTTTFMSIQL